MSKLRTSVIYKIILNAEDFVFVKMRILIYSSSYIYPISKDNFVVKIANNIRITLNFLEKDYDRLH